MEISLSNKELELLIIGLRCIDERGYDFHTTSYDTYDEIKPMKEQLRTKLLRALLNT